MWTDVIRQIRPDIGREQCDATAHALLALINSISLRRSPDPVSPAVREHLRAMAIGAAYSTAGARRSLPAEIRVRGCLELTR